MREIAYCSECGKRLDLYVVGVCSRCDFDLTGNDPERDAKEARARLGAADSPPNEKEA